MPLVGWGLGHSAFGRITLSSRQAKAAKAGVPLPGDDDVVMDSNAEQLANLVNLLGHVDIGPGRGGVTGWVVVDEDAAGGMQFDRSPQNLARIHRRVIDCVPSARTSSAIRLLRLSRYSTRNCSRGANAIAEVR